MTDRDKDLAREHVEWYMGLLKKQMLAWFDITESLLVENFVHGIKHGREMEREDLRAKKLTTINLNDQMQEVMSVKMKK